MISEQYNQEEDIFLNTVKRIGGEWGMQIQSTERFIQLLPQILFQKLQRHKKDVFALLIQEYMDGKKQQQVLI